MSRSGIGVELLAVHSVLFSHFGDPDWWPGEDPFEVAVGAILTQNTKWDNVERALENLKKKDVMDPFRMAGMPGDELSRLIRPAGFFNQKSEYLRELSLFVREELSGDISTLARMPLSTARNRLLSLKGIGKETADSILCYGAHLPVLVIDSYTWRFTDRFFGGLSGIGIRKGDYDSLQSLLMRELRGDALLFNRFHALLVLLSKSYCRRVPLCRACPLSRICSLGSR